MFYAYGSSGIVFSGTLETLLGSRRVEEIRGAQPGAGIGADGQPAGAAPREAAKEAYRHAIEWQNRPGPVYHANQIMTSPVIVVAPDTTVKQAWKRMRDKRIRHLPVVTADRNLIGIISENDFTRNRSEDGHVIPSGQPDASIESLMISPVLTASAMTDIRRIAHLLLERKIGSMPIMNEDGTLAGIITRSDILRALINNPGLSIWA